MSSLTRREFTRATVATLAAPLLNPTSVEGQKNSPTSRPQTPSSNPSCDLPVADLVFLRDMTRDVLAASTVQPGAGAGGYRSSPNTCDFPLITPGRGTYPAFWVRDFSMALESGLIEPDLALAHLRLIARCQNGPRERRLTSGAIIPPGAVPDHINYDGSAVFYPGTYSPNDDQGGKSFGVLPPVDDYFEFIRCARTIWRSTGRTDFLDENIAGTTLLERLITAFKAPEVDESTGLFMTTTERRAVGFGFCDTVIQSGKLLFASLLRRRAAGDLAELLAARGQSREAKVYRAIQRDIATHLPNVFQDDHDNRGWLLAATQTSCQPDVWGTIFALFDGALSGTAAQNAEEAVVHAVRDGTICLNGGVRHVPTNRDFSTDSAWEKTVGVAIGRYQNGAYWHTPTGWLIVVLSRTAPELGRRIFDEYIAHLKKEDFRRGTGYNAPWECIGPNGNGNQNPVYLASVALPYGVLRGLAQNRDPSARR